MDTTHPSLLMRIRDRSDNSAWTRFKQAYERLLRAYILRRGQVTGAGGAGGGSWRDQRIDELVHDVLVHLWFKLPEFELDQGIGRFRTYLYRVVSNFLADQDPDRKRRKRAEMKTKAQGDEAAPAASAPARPKVLSEAQAPLDNVAAPHEEEEDEPWRDEFNKAQLAIVLNLLRDEALASDNPNKWLAFEKHWLQQRGAGEVAAELGIKPDLVYKNASRMLETVRTRFKAEFGQELAL